MSYVHVIQDHWKVNRSTGVLEPKYDFTPALEYGDIRFLVSHDANPWDRAVVQEFRRKLRAFCPEEDYLLLIGDPALIAMAGFLLGSWGVQRFLSLRWDRKQRVYYPLVVHAGGDYDDTERK